MPARGGFSSVHSLNLLNSTVQALAWATAFCLQVRGSFASVASRSVCRRAGRVGATPATPRALCVVSHAAHDVCERACVCAQLQEAAGALKRYQNREWPLNEV